MREYAMRQLNADFIATGHYARLWHRYNDHGNNHNKILQATSSPPPFLEAALAQNPDDEWVYEWGMKHDGTRSSKAPISPLLLAGADTTKDQSYFLCGVNGMAFSNVLFPLGNLKKNTKSNKEEAQKSVREMVADFPPSISNKKESMGICFIGKRNFADFVAEYLPSEAIPGDFIDIDTGEVVGKHNGAAFYTIGQGAKVSGARTKYFTAKKNANGSIFVCNDTHHPSLYSDELYMLADQFNWIVGELPRPLEEGKDMVALCRTRHLQPLIPCVVSIRGSHIVVKFDRPIRAITPGQTAAIYVGDGLVCVGGGQISEHGHTYNELGLTLPSTLHPSGANDISCPT
jgi:tRNA U34 2-thiouridine synthase MnmA/TrmU